MTSVGQIPRIGTKLAFEDAVGACKARWGIGRMNYIVPPGLYAIGHPSAEDPVLVTANYKMSYDIVRQQMANRNVWLLVLETSGINVWCAAGKGTFGTMELIERIQHSGLAQLVLHRQLLLPILGAPGVAAHEVKKRTNFTIKYATIRAQDLPEYLDNGMVTTQGMRELTFSLRERLILIPVELVGAMKVTAVIMALLAVAVYIFGGTTAAIAAITGYLGAVLVGVIIAPLLLPWLPGRSFSIKGAIAGMVWALIFSVFIGRSGFTIPTILAALLGIAAVSAFYTLNFTGCTTFTSRSGVKKELRLALPVMAGAIVACLLLLIGSRFL